MDIKHTSQVPTITKIEDIIDLQKANGNINVRQVAFKVPFEVDSNISATMTKSLESGLSKSKPERLTKKVKKIRIRSIKNAKDSMSDAISWPSDSDITVLRMKLRSKVNRKDEVGNIISGDGLHQPDSSSMINLATLILQSQRPSKQSINIEEYLMPLTSWEHAAKVKSNKGVESNNEISNFESNNDINKLEASCSHYEEFNIRNSTLCNSNTKSKVARFLRLYFCPCCSCLYKIEKMQDEPSAYFTKH